MTGYNFSNILLELEAINNSLLAFWSAGCFETDPEFGPPWERAWSLGLGFQSEEDLLEALRDGVSSRLREALLEIDEDIDEVILQKLLP